MSIEFFPITKCRRKGNYPDAIRNINKASRARRIMRNWIKECPEMSQKDALRLPRSCSARKSNVLHNQSIKQNTRNGASIDTVHQTEWTIAEQKWWSRKILHAVLHRLKTQSASLDGEQEEYKNNFDRWQSNRDHHLWTLQNQHYSNSTQ